MDSTVLLYLLVFLLQVASAHEAIKFDPFVPTEEYKCTQFMRDAVEDKAMEHYYRITNQVISSLSKSFPHRELVSQRMLQGDFEAWKETFLIKYYQWIDYEQWWIVFGGLFLALCTLFSLGYFFYRCCVCCCRKRVKDTTDHEYDRCKRNFLNTLLSFIVIANVFAAAALFISTQYMEYGVDKLPQRVNNCIDDLNLYKRNTDEQVRKLLINDYQKLNHSLMASFSRGGDLIVAKIKEITGADAVDNLILVAKNASDVISTTKKADYILRETNDEMIRFKNEFSRMKKTSSEELLECVKNEIDPKKQRLCQGTSQMLDSLDTFKTELDIELAPLLSSTDLQTIIQANISENFRDTLGQFKQFAEDVQNHIDKRTISVINQIKQIGDGLFQVAESFSNQIRQIYFDGLYDTVNRYTEKDSTFAQYLEYSRYGSLVLSGIFVFVSLTFLLGLCYGCCGRRPSFDDDCCVRKTGSKFFSCGIFVSLLLMCVLSVLTVSVMFVGGNAANLVCHPLNNPLLRTDMLSFADRVVHVWNANRTSSNDAGIDVSKMKIADIIRGCEGKETFYSMLNLDQKHHLSNIMEFQEPDYDMLKRYVRSLLASFSNNSPVSILVGPEQLKLLESLAQVNLKPTVDEAIITVEKQINNLDLLPKAEKLRDDLMDFQESPKAVEGVLNNLSALENNHSRPIRENLEKLLMLLKDAKLKLQEMNIPFDDLPGKLQHAQALLKTNFQEFFINSSAEIIDAFQSDIDGYIKHVMQAVKSDVTGCEPVAQIARGVRSAVCANAVDPMNGIWMSMLLSLLLTLVIILLSTPLLRLYKHVHSYPKYTVHEPLGEHQMSAFATDTYDSRLKNQVYASNYGNYSDVYPPPYLASRSRS